MLWVCIAASVFGQTADEPWRWPLDLPRQITSSFGEYRGGRFHAAIDLRTGPIGQKVYAAGDGHVSRIRCSPYGYGKAVYLTLNDGYTVVYGHLDGFEGSLAEHVRAAQHRAKSYTVDLYPEPHEFPVRKGDLIARSGETGVGVPHLHYEWRDRTGKPVDPRPLGTEWPDATAPVLNKVLIVGKDPSVLLNGSPEPLVLTPAVNAADPTRYTLPALHATGPFAIGVDLHDPANGGANKLGVHVLRTERGGAEIFRVEHNVLGYDTLGDGRVAYHPAFLGEGRFLMTYRWPGNRSESYAHSPGEGWIAPGQDGDLRVEAIDFHGNSATLDLPLAAEPPSAPQSAPGNAAPGTVDYLPIGEWILGTVNFPAAEAEPPVLLVDGAEVAMTSRDGRRWAAGAMAKAGADRMNLDVRHARVASQPRDIAVFRSGKAGEARFGDITLSVPAGLPYGTLYAEAYPLPDAPVPAPVSAYGTAYMVWPLGAPMNGSAEISLPLPEGLPNPDAARVYRMGGSSWGPVSSRIAGGRIVAETGGFGAFMVMIDDQRPRISGIAPENGGAAANRRPAIQARISDIGSGIGSITVTCGEQWLLMEFDPEEGRIVWAADEDLPAGEQTIRFRIADNAGNVTEAARTIRIP